MFADNYKIGESTLKNLKFIVVYDRFTKPVANSLKNKAIEKSITSTSWSEQEYLANEMNLDNNNHVLFLSEKLFKENLSDPSLPACNLIEAVFYKKQGHIAGIYVHNGNVKCSEIASRVGSILKESWGKAFLSMIATGLLGVALYTLLKYRSKEKQAKLYLLFRAKDCFEDKHLKDFVNDSL